jgi:hypothetical protein
MSDDAPILVTGPDRSGTSLMYALLASHSNISMSRRTNMWRWFYGKYGDLNRPADFERCLQQMLRYERMQVLQPDEDRIREEFLDGEASYGRLFALFHGHFAELRGKERWGDKSLHTEHHADQVFCEFPSARMIHLMRDPRDRYGSIKKRYDRPQKGVAPATGRWLTSTWAARRKLRRYPDRYMVVRYEDLAARPEETLEEVCEFLGESYEPSMLSMGDAPDHGAIGGNSSFGQMEPGTISTRSIGRFRTVLSPEEIAYIQMSCGRYMKEYGYGSESTGLSSRERLAFLVKDAPLTSMRVAGWITVDKVRELRGRTVPDRRLANASP